MSLFQEIRQRRVPQIVGGFVAGSWAIIQFLEFLEGRMAISPNMVNLIALALLLMLPSVLTLAWVHGRPGRDSWGRAPKVVLPSNLVAVLVLLGMLFRGQELGAITQTIEVEDEHGAMIERIIPKNEFRRNVMVYYAENTGSADEDWARETISTLVAMDVSQDVFVTLTVPAAMVGALKDVGSSDGHRLSRSLQRKLAQDAHVQHFVTSSVNHQNDTWSLTTELHESESGKIVATREFESTEIFALADLASVQLRKDLGVPSSHIENSQDLPVSEMMTTDIEALKGHIEGVLKATHDNDWEGAIAPLEDAVKRDPGFSLAHFLLFGIYQTVGRMEDSSAAISASMEHLHRLPERTRFLIKTQYYYNEKQDADKSLAVLKMWSQIYPNDVGAYAQQAMLYIVRQDIPNAIASYEKILEIDPSQVQYLEEVANLHSQLGHYDEAESYLQRYVDIFPSRSDGYKDLADFYRETGQLDKARASLEKAQLIEPESLGLAIRVINLDVKLGEFAKSRIALDSLLKSAKNPRERSSVYAQQTNLALLTGRADVVVESLELFYAAILEDRNPLQAKIIYAMRLPAISSVGKPEEALRRLNEVASEIGQPYDKMASVGKAWALSDLGRLDEAHVALTEATDIADTFKFETLRPSLAFVGGMIAEAEGDLEAATSFFQLAVDIALQTESSYLVRLAHVLRLQGHPDQAMDSLNEALKFEPGYPEAHLEMALVMQGQGNFDRARDHLAKAQAAWVDADPDFSLAVQAREMVTRLN
jgi:tetratricopeptide (TPR) repeat protein